MAHLLRLTVCSGLLFGVLAVLSPAFAAERTPVTISENSPLALRVLTRPHAVLYKDASEANPADSNIPVFKPYFVYTRPGGEARETGTGWYEVGTDEKGTIAGWIQSADVFEWKQTMCLAYSHPMNRKPVLMFEDKEKLDALVKADPAARAEEITKLYAAIDNAAATPLAEDFPVLSVEPKMAVDMARQFYLLPILEHEEMTLESHEGRLVRLAAVSGKADAPRADGSDIRKNAAYTKAATAENASAGEATKDLNVDIVWVMDTTRSMQPYIEEVRTTMSGVTRALADAPELKGKLSFGMWAYRDSEEITGIEYNTRNMTPELLASEEFLKVMADVKETTVDSVDVAEDMFGGVEQAILQTKWRPGSVRVVILVGDAPSHNLGHKWNSTGKDHLALRPIATENKVAIFSLHVKPGVNKKYNTLAETQFKALAVNPGSDTPMYWPFSSKEREQFAATTSKIGSALIEHMKRGLGGSVFAESATPQAQAEASAQVPAPASAPAEAKNGSQATTSATKPKAEAVGPTDEQVRKALQAATVTWLGSKLNVEPPRDIEAWVADKDLLTPSVQSLEVRLLVSKRQLDSLAVMLNEIVAAGREQQSSSDDFFTSLQGVSAAASRNADQIAKATTLQEAGLVPAFLEGLPYKSQIMSMSSELWASWGPDEQDQFIENLVSKVEAYKTLHNTPDNWVSLNAGDSADDHVTPIPLELLP